eukprot:TRINITY_DN1257_c0_g1_i6.p1 TRINITY_DN1257_c0_g1~~TRINITY_DN1257_c0_g1_i6.p1  ORF type:complete len:209 (+),score=32.60 TRINITY_DN1257_c0_g1_i6:560-1186(+)
MPLKAEVAKEDAHHAAFRDMSSRDKVVLEGDEGADFVVLDGIASGLKSNPTPGFQSKSERFKLPTTTKGPVTYLDEKIQMPSQEGSWMFKGSKPTEPRVPTGTTQDIPYYDLPPGSSGGTKFGTDARFPTSFTEDEPGPGDYSERPTSTPRGGVPSLAMSAKRFEGRTSDTPGPAYEIPGMADLLTARSSHSATGVAFDSTGLRFEED